MENGSLDSLLRKQPSMEWKMKLSILIDIAAGMYHLSSVGFLHKDLGARNGKFLSYFIYNTSSNNMIA